MFLFKKGLPKLIDKPLLQIIKLHYINKHITTIKQNLE